MRLNRRTFHQLFLMSAAYQLRPDRYGFALAKDWQDLAQPFAAQIQRLLAALEWIGEPFPPDQTARLKAILARGPQSDTVNLLDTILKQRVLINVDINPESRVSVSRGAAKAELVENGWRSFLVRVTNQSRDTSVLSFRSPQAKPMGRPSSNATQGVHDFTIGAVDAVEARSRWMALNAWDKPPLQPALSGLELEYRILQIYSRDRGQREASIEAVTDAGIQDLGFRSTLPILFTCLPAHQVKLRLRDQAGVPAAASLLIMDKLGRVYPAQSKRPLPDLWFQPQIYRRDGESISLPAGSYSIAVGRGPEYLTRQITVDIQDVSPSVLDLSLDRWIRPSEFGYYSGDTHIHAAGCSHYESPSEGVTPEVMARQVEGEALDMGAVLTWAPGFRYQSQFFSGHVYHIREPLDNLDNSANPDNSGTKDGSAKGGNTSREPEPTLRYDIEVSGFPSSHCGHLVLLKLKEQIYPGAENIDDWPSWNLPILQWAKSQGAITGYAHSGWGMVVNSVQVPNYVVPAFDSCGANEYLVDVTHEGMLDFISGCDLWPFVEMNLWYHVLNCGYRLRFAGETDFPCITDKCVGGGRSYTRLESPPEGDDGYRRWLVEGLELGRSYFGDGRSHIFDFAIAGTRSGQWSGEQLHLDAPATIHVSARLCARLEPEVTPATEKIRRTSPYREPFWHLERSRIGGARKVPVELVVNGIAVDRREIEADGAVREIAFDIPIRQSSWIALRIFPSSHTNPLFIELEDRPVRASRKSAEWCRRGVDVCWSQKSLRIRPSEIPAARDAYDRARAAYDRIISESYA